MRRSSCALSQRLASGHTRYAEAEESYERLIRELEKRPVRRTSPSPTHFTIQR